MEAKGDEYIMKKKNILTFAAAALSLTVMTGCSGTSGNTQETSHEAATEAAAETDAAEESTAEGDIDESKEGVANPWTESDKEGVAEATGIEIEAPEDATDVTYSYMEETGLAQVQYRLDEADWVYRAQSAAEFTDISGMYYDWESEDDCEISGRKAVCYGLGGIDEPDRENVQMVNWYDAVPGIMYSLSVSGRDLNGMDLTVYAENLFVPMQGEATDDPERDRENELNDYFLGEHKKSYDDSTLTISDNNDGTFAVNISITRLCDLDGTGNFDDHKMYFEAEDPSGGKLSGMIYRDSDNSLTVKITDSTWEYLPDDEVIDGFGK